jgi:CBS domain-containing protein
MTTARDLLQRKAIGTVFTIGPDDTVLAAAKLMNEAHIGSLVVVDSLSGVVGMFSERDILTRVVAESRPPEQTRVREVMTTKVTCCAPDTPIAQCQEIMTVRRMRHLPVIENNSLIGLISTGDVMAHEVTQQQVTIEYMNEYIQGTRSRARWDSQAERARPFRPRLVPNSTNPRAWTSIWASNCCTLRGRTAAQAICR